MDDINQKVLAILQENARISFQTIGKMLHITGQAISARVKQLEDDAIITQYTIHRSDLQQSIITVYMETRAYEKFEAIYKANPNVISFSKVSGEGCYIMTLQYHEVLELDDFLVSILRFGRYRINNVMRRIK